MAPKIIEVAAAVLLRNTTGTPFTTATPQVDAEFLLACRPEGKVYAGYWEFPGGKLESGESVYDALVRELHEEMGITVTAATPWLHKQFTYPHATVHLNFWRVTAWNGEIGVTAPLEHSAFDWLPLSEALHAEQQLSPILPANGPILKGLALPTQLWITHAEAVGTTAELARLAQRLSEGKRGILQIRDQHLPTDSRREFAYQACQLAKNKGVLVVLNSANNADMALAKAIDADGVHLTSQALAGLIERPDFMWVGASCHTEAELLKAGELGLDYALLGPVLPTQTHPETPPLGWEKFTRLMSDNQLPVFALGGLSVQDLDKAQQAGAHGIALMRGW